jgi:hypothetical protein
MAGTGVEGTLLTSIPGVPLGGASSSTNKKLLLSNATTGEAAQQQLYGEGQGVGSFLTPQLEAQAANPQGYTPQQMAYMNTASQQSLGGSTAGVTGQANLQAARTRNAGGFSGAIGSGSRAAQQQLSQNALGIQSNQANLQQQQRQQALQSLQGLYGTDINSSLGYMNSSNQALSDRMGKGGSSNSTAAIGAIGTAAAAAL